MPKSVPTIGQQNWGQTLNDHLAQFSSPTTGGINSGITVQRPTKGAEDTGYTYFDTTTRQVLRWNGTPPGSWEVLLSGLPNNQSLTVAEVDGTPTIPDVQTITFQGATVTNQGNGEVLVSVGGGSSFGTVNGLTGGRIVTPVPPVVTDPAISQFIIDTGLNTSFFFEPVILGVFQGQIRGSANIGNGTIIYSGLVTLTNVTGSNARATGTLTTASIPYNLLPPTTSQAVLDQNGGNLTGAPISLDLSTNFA